MSTSPNTTTSTGATRPAAPGGHTGWCDPASCDLHDIDPRHTSPAARWNGDGPGAALGLAVTRIDHTAIAGTTTAGEHDGWVHTLSVPLADITIRDGQVLLELSDDDADMLRARLEENRARMAEMQQRDR